MQSEFKDNPYVAVVAKKCRNLKKKMDRILNLESHQNEGKLLDEEQKVLCMSKGTVERSLTDLKVLLSQLEEVAKETAPLTLENIDLRKADEPEEECKSSLADVDTVNVANNTIDRSHNDTPTAEFPLSAVNSNANSLMGSGAPSPTNLPPREDVGEARKEDNPQYTTTGIAAEASETENETGAITSTTTAPVTSALAADNSTEIVKTEIEKFIKHATQKLVKVMHVCSRYTSITHKPLPPFVDFFGKSLLGQTSIKGFTDTFQGSVKSVSYYLDDSESALREVVGGLTYKQLSELVDALALEIKEAPSSTIATATTTAAAAAAAAGAATTTTTTTVATAGSGLSASAASVASTGTVGSNISTLEFQPRGASQNKKVNADEKKNRGEEQEKEQQKEQEEEEEEVVVKEKEKKVVVKEEIGGAMLEKTKGKFENQEEDQEEKAKRTSFNSRDQAHERSFPICQLLSLGTAASEDKDDAGAKVENEKMLQVGTVEDSLPAMESAVDSTERRSAVSRRRNRGRRNKNKTLDDTANSSGTAGVGIDDDDDAKVNNATAADGHIDSVVDTGDLASNNPTTYSSTTNVDGGTMTQRLSSADLSDPHATQALQAAVMEDKFVPKHSLAAASASLLAKNLNFNFFPSATVEEEDSPITQQLDPLQVQQQQEVQFSYQPPADIHMPYQQHTPEYPFNQHLQMPPMHMQYHRMTPPPGFEAYDTTTTVGAGAGAYVGSSTEVGTSSTAGFVQRDVAIAQVVQDRTAISATPTNDPLLPSSSSSSSSSSSYANQQQFQLHHLQQSQQALQHHHQQQHLLLQQQQQQQQQQAGLFYYHHNHQGSILSGLPSLNHEPVSSTQSQPLQHLHHSETGAALAAHPPPPNLIPAAVRKRSSSRAAPAAIINSQSKVAPVSSNPQISGITTPAAMIDNQTHTAATVALQPASTVPSSSEGTNSQPASASASASISSNVKSAVSASASISIPTTTMVSEEVPVVQDKRRNSKKSKAARSSIGIASNKRDADDSAEHLPVPPVVATEPVPVPVEATGIMGVDMSRGGAQASPPQASPPQQAQESQEVLEAEAEAPTQVEVEVEGEVAVAVAVGVHGERKKRMRGIRGRGGRGVRDKTNSSTSIGSSSGSNEVLIPEVDRESKSDARVDDTTIRRTPVAETAKVTLDAVSAADIVHVQGINPNVPTGENKNKPSAKQKQHQRSSGDSGVATEKATRNPVAVPTTAAAATANASTSTAETPYSVMATKTATTNEALATAAAKKSKSSAVKHSPADSSEVSMQAPIPIPLPIEETQKQDPRDKSHKPGQMTQKQVVAGDASYKDTPAVRKNRPKNAKTSTSSSSEPVAVPSPPVVARTATATTNNANNQRRKSTKPKSTGISSSSSSYSSAAATSAATVSTTADLTTALKPFSYASAVNPTSSTGMLKKEPIFKEDTKQSASHRKDHRPTTTTTRVSAAASVPQQAAAAAAASTATTNTSGRRRRKAPSTNL